MNLYILETIVAIIIAIVVIVILKIKKIEKILIALIIICTTFILTIGTTFVLEKPVTDNIATTLDIEVNEIENIEIPKVIYHYKDVTNTVKIARRYRF